MLAVERLHKRFGMRTVLHDISFTVAGGEVVGLVGESGSGKTTIARCVLGLEPATSGAIRWNHHPIVAGLRIGPWRRDVQMVAQDPRASLDPRWTIVRSIAEPLRNWSPGLTEAQRRSALETLAVLVRLDPTLFSRYPHELSTGECQRACIARALAAEPRLVVFDEPFSALDMTIQADLLSLLRAIRSERGLGCLFISHDVVVVGEICDRVLVLDRGRIVEEMSSGQALLNPKHPYTRELVADIPRVPWAMWKGDVPRT